MLTPQFAITGHLEELAQQELDEVFVTGQPSALLR